MPGMWWRLPLRHFCRDKTLTATPGSHLVNQICYKKSTADHLYLTYTTHSFHYYKFLYTQVNFEGEELLTAVRRAQAKQEKIDKTIDNLLDNLTPTNREYVDQRLIELKQQKQQLKTRLEELNQLSLSQAEINSIVTDSMQFLSSLEFTLRQGLLQEKLVALRQCIEKIWVNKPAGKIKLAIYLVPAGNLQATEELKASV